jgi:hypothetical protein
MDRSSFIQSAQAFHLEAFDIELDDVRISQGVRLSNRIAGKDGHARRTGCRAVCRWFNAVGSRQILITQYHGCLAVEISEGRFDDPDVVMPGRVHSLNDRISALGHRLERYDFAGWGHKTG